MLALRRAHDADVALPFRSAEEAWLWTMAALLARRDGAGLSWRPDGPTRPCDPEDILRSLDTLYRERSIELLHARILRIWGERQAAPRPDRVNQRSDWRLWYQALGQLEWALRARGIVRWVVGQSENNPTTLGVARDLGPALSSRGVHPQRPARMTTKPLPRPRDPLALAKLVGDIATGQVEDGRGDGKDAGAAAMGRKGGAARAAAMTPERRAEIAKKAAAKRWGDSKT